MTSSGSQWPDNYEFHVRDVCLRLLELDKADYKTIYDKIVEFSNLHERPHLQNLIGLAYDGANVIVYWKNSVITLLKNYLFEFRLHLPFPGIICIVCHKTIVYCYWRLVAWNLQLFEAQYQTVTMCERIPKTLGSEAEQVIKITYMIFDGCRWIRVRFLKQLSALLSFFKEEEKNKWKRNEDFKKDQRSIQYPVFEVLGTYATKSCAV